MNRRSCRSRIERIEDLNRNIFNKGRLQAGRINHFGPKVAQFHGFSVGNGRNREGIGNLARIGGHHSVHVGPNFNYIGIKRRAKNGACIVRASASKRSGDSFGGRADKARNALQRIGFSKMR